MSGNTWPHGASLCGPPLSFAMRFLFSESDCIVNPISFILRMADPCWTSLAHIPLVFSNICKYAAPSPLPHVSSSFPALPLTPSLCLPPPPAATIVLFQPLRPRPLQCDLPLDAQLRRNPFPPQLPLAQRQIQPRAERLALSRLLHCLLEFRPSGNDLARDQTSWEKIGGEEARAVDAVHGA